jgi:hypothetical protein
MTVVASAARRADTATTVMLADLVQITRQERLDA